MRFLLLFMAISAGPAGALAAAEPAAPVFSLSPAPAAPAPTPYALVEAWLAERAPECPPALAPEVTAKFLEQLARQRPADAAQLGQPGMPLADFESLLWQVLAARLTGPAYEAPRAAFATRRVQGLLAAQGRPVTAVPAAVARLKTDAPASYRRLAEGRMEDEDVLRLPGLDPEREAQRRATPAAATGPKDLTAQDLVSEFARRNQVGAAAAKLRAYLVEARIRASDGSEQQLQLFKLRPGRFRLHLRQPDGSLQVFAGDGARYWHQAGPRVEEVPAAALGPLRYFAEFVDPLLESEGVRFERLPDGEVDGRKCHRLRVVRADGSGYVAVVDAENFRQVAQENPDGGRTRYADFREVAGLTFAWREEVTRAGGATAVMEITRLVPEPGLVAAFFNPPIAGQFDFDPLDQALAPGGTR